MKRPACVVGCCLIIFLGLILLLRMPEPFSDESISGRTLFLHGTIDDKYQKKSSTYLVIRNAGSVSGEGTREKHKIIVKLKEARPSLAMLPPVGSPVTVKGKGMLFARARNPGNFDLAEYEMIRGIDYELYDAEITDLTELPDAVRIDEILCILRERLSDTVDMIYGKDEAGIIKAMLLGDRADLSDEIKDSFRRSGMSHILCISALHITLLGMSLLKLLRRTGLNKAACYVISFAFICMYGRFTGSGISTVRAVITFGLMMAADIAGRTPDLLSSMSVAATAVLLMRPLYIKDAGFILSFTAVSGIGLLGPPLKRLMPFRHKLPDTLGAAVAVTLFMLPVTLYFFFQVPLFSVLINLAVIPLLGILLGCALISVLLGCLWSSMGMAAAIPAKLILRAYDLLTVINDRIPMSLLTPGRPGILQIILYYAVIAVIIYITGKKEKTDCRVRLLCLFLYLGAVFMLTVHIRPELSLTMIDVGQGDCHLIEMQDGKTMMIDCGSSDTDNAAKYRVIPYVLSRGFDRIDYAVLTHPDEDHINGYLEMLETEGESSLKTGCFILPDIPEPDENYERLVDMAEKKNIRVFKIKSGDSFDIGRVSFRCLNPEKGRRFTDMNEASVCLVLSIKESGFKALYTGDIEGEAESRMISELSCGRYTLLKCAHHGSKNSTPDRLLEKIKPACAFISAGVDNKYGHPHEELIERLDRAGTRIYATNKEGAVRMDVNGKRVSITGFLNEGGIR